MPSVQELVEGLEQRLLRGRITDPGLLAKANEVLQWDDDVVPVVGLRPPAKPRDIALLAATVKGRYGMELPEDLVAFLRCHDGMCAKGRPPEDLDGEIDLESADNSVMSVAMLHDAMDEIEGAVENELAPAGLFPFFRAYADDYRVLTSLLLVPGAPNAGVVVAYDLQDLPSHRTAADLDSYEVVASSFTDWLGAWFESGFSSHARALPYSTTTAEPVGPIVAGDVITVDGKGFHWVTEVFEQHGRTQVRYETFATNDKQPAGPGYPRVAHDFYCRKVSDAVRAEVIALIPSDVRRILPSNRPPDT